MRMFKEVERRPEVTEKVQTSASENFKQIKPQEGMTLDEARNFLDNLFNDMLKNN